MPNLLRSVRGCRVLSMGWNVADRLAFTEVLATGRPLHASMDEVYQVWIRPQGTTTLESYLQEYSVEFSKAEGVRLRKKTKNRHQKTPLQKS